MVVENFGNTCGRPEFNVHARFFFNAALNFLDGFEEGLLEVFRTLQINANSFPRHVYAHGQHFCFQVENLPQVMSRQEVLKMGPEV